MILMVGIGGTIPALAQESTSSSITVTTDKPTYSDGDQMVISGTVGTQLNVPISVVVRDPSGNIVSLAQVSPNPNNTYSTTITAGGDLWSAVGSYVIDVTYGSKDNTARTSFQFAGSTLVLPITIEGQVYNATYKITNGKVLGAVATISANSLAIRIQPSGSGMLTITLPRSLMDAKSNSQDGQFVVDADGVAAKFNETMADVTSRTLAIPFGSANAQITIIGTQIVPEFNAVSILVLGIAMTSAIFYYTSRSKIKI